jgi:putative ABC transport system permease protein
MTLGRKLKYLLPWHRRAVNREILEELDSLAALAAPGELSNLTLAAEDARAMWGWVWLERLWQDLRYGGRMLAKNPGFAAVAVVSLAIGVGANCAMFSYADGLLLRPLPVPRPNEVVTVSSTTSAGPSDTLTASYQDYVDVRDRSQSFDGLAAFTNVNAGFSSQPGALPHVRLGKLVTGNFLSVLKVKPELGRDFRNDEDQVPGRDAVVILSHDFWEQEFGSDPSVLGKRVRSSEIEFTIIGVAPARFTGVDSGLADHAAFYLPMMMAPRMGNDPDILNKRDLRTLTVKGRLQRSVAISQARAEVATIAAALEKQYPETNRNRSMTVLTEMEARIKQQGDTATGLFLLMTMAGAVLLVACANVAGLLASRAPARAREIAMRLAMGAGRTRLIRQLLTESLLLAAAGGLAGLGVGDIAITVFRQIRLPEDWPQPSPFALDERAMLFSMTLALLSVVLFGLMPALQTTRVDLNSAMKNVGGDTRRGRRHRLLHGLWGRNLLVPGQVAVSLVVFVIASDSYIQARRALARGPGFRTDHVLMMSFNPSLVHYKDAQTRQFYSQLLERVRSLSGVKSATLTSTIGQVAILPEGYQFPPGQSNATLSAIWTDESFFDTLAIPILRGRGFRATDSAGTPGVAVVTQKIAQEYWPGQDPIGKRFRLDSSNGPPIEVMGVAKPNNLFQFGTSPVDFVYFPYAQTVKQRGLTLLTQTAGDPTGLVGPLREVVRQLDSNQPIDNVGTLQAMYDAIVRYMQAISRTVGAMGVMGLLLALAGLYGLVAYAVSTRTHEIGVRMALGADRGSVLRMVLRHAFMLAVAGIVAGVVLGIGAGRLLDASSPGNSNSGGDDLSNSAYAVMVLVALALTMLAAYIPARRAARVDPNVALRCE